MPIETTETFRYFIVAAIGLTVYASCCGLEWIIGRRSSKKDKAKRKSWEVPVARGSFDPPSSDVNVTYTEKQEYPDGRRVTIDYHSDAPSSGYVQAEPSEDKEWRRLTEQAKAVRNLLAETEEWSDDLSFAIQDLLERLRRYDIPFLNFTSLDPDAKLFMRAYLASLVVALESKDLADAREVLGRCGIPEDMKPATQGGAERGKDE